MNAGVSLTVLLIAISFSDASTFAQDQAIELPNLSGKWRFVASQSDLETESPSHVVYEIQHSMTRFELVRVTQFDDDEDKLELQLTIGDFAKRTRHRNASLLSWVRTEGNEIVLVMKIRRNGSLSTKTIRFRSERRGTTMVVEEEFLGPRVSYENHWVFERIED